MHDDFERNFIVEYFKEMRAEINLRVTTHSNYVVYKTAACGAILSFLLTRNSKDDVVAYGVILVPLIAMLYDVMIAKNVLNIHRLGIFIRDKLEPQMPKLTLWEEFAGQRDVKVRCYGSVDVIFLSMFTLATIGCTGVLLGQNISIAVAMTATFLLIGIFLFSTWFMYRCFLFFTPPGAENWGAEESETTANTPG